jgi:hypothetical protein
MLVSSTSMNVARVTAMAMIHGLIAGRGAATATLAATNTVPVCRMTSGSP